MKETELSLSLVDKLYIINALEKMASDLVNLAAEQEEEGDIVLAKDTRSTGKYYLGIAAKIKASLEKGERND